MTNRAKNVLLNHTQAEMFARLIIADIKNYVDEHQEEYEQFLIDEKNEDSQLNGETLKLHILSKERSPPK